MTTKSEYVKAQPQATHQPDVDAVGDSQYLAGLQAGFQFGYDNNEAGFAKAQESCRAGLAEHRKDRAQPQAAPNDWPAKEIASEIMDDLRGRSGCLDDVDSETRQEMLATFTAIINRRTGQTK